MYTAHRYFALISVQPDAAVTFIHKLPDCADAVAELVKLLKYFETPITGELIIVGVTDPYK